MWDIYDVAGNVDPFQVRTLVTARPAAVFERLNDGTTLLHESAARGRKKLIALLLALGADPNARTSAQMTPLHIASDECNPSIPAVERLIGAGADVRATEYRGFTPLAMAARRPHLRPQAIVELLMRCGAVLDLNSALWLGRFDHIRQHLRDDPDLIRRGRSEEVPFPADLLANAVHKESPEMVELLLATGADVNGRPETMRTTALAETVVDWRDPVLAERLLWAGADPNVRYGDRSLLDWARYIDNPGLIAALQSFGAAD
jgi:ankyrin repeat protein